MRILESIASRLRGSKLSLDITTIKDGNGWLARNLTHRFVGTEDGLADVRERARITSLSGGHPVWEGYRAVEDYPKKTTGNRTSAEVRTSEDTGSFFIWLAKRRRPNLIVEFGTAFGISGMYWLTGLKFANTTGKLMTYEPNSVWAELAEDNLRAISSDFILTRGTFEENAASTLAPRSVDIAFIDAIHTSSFVDTQYNVLRPYLADNALVLFDDINFSPDMRSCWQRIAVGSEVLSSVSLGDRVGIVELA